MKIVSLASGSKGNATVIEGGGAILLIDVGLTCKDLLARFSAAGFSLDALAGVLITHSHTDHVAALKTLVKKTGVAVYANAMTAETIVAQEKMDEADFVCFENGQPFTVGPFEVAAFSIPHDTSDPVGYLVRVEGKTYFHGTDIGTPLDSVGLKFAEADVATLESNHDPVMLRTSGRPPSLIQRIAGPRGHLSNDQSADLVARFASSRLAALALGHLSHDCNAPHLVESTMRAALERIHRPDVALRVLSQVDSVTIYSNSKNGEFGK